LPIQFGLVLSQRIVVATENIPCLRGPSQLVVVATKNLSGSGGGTLRLAVGGHLVAELGQALHSYAQLPVFGLHGLPNAIEWHRDVGVLLLDQGVDGEDVAVDNFKRGLGDNFTADHWRAVAGEVGVGLATARRLHLSVGSRTAAAGVGVLPDTVAEVKVQARAGLHSS
jgi:hypothetical protein